MYEEEISGYCSCINDLQNWYDDISTRYRGDMIPKFEVIKLLDELNNVCE